MREGFLADGDSFPALCDEYHRLFVHRMNRPGRAADPHEIKAGDAGSVHTFTLGVSSNEIGKLHPQT